jgi:O-antigen ligase
MTEEMEAAPRVIADGGVALVRAMLLALIVLMELSTSASIAVELLVYMAFLVLPALWPRVIRVMRLPVCLGFLAFTAAIAIATVYGAAPWLDRVTGFIAWRRTWLLPIAAAVFDDEGSKRMVLSVMVWSCVLAALVSFVTAAGSIVITTRLYDGIIFRNYANQGITFSVAASVCIAALLRPQAFAGDRLLGNRWLMSAALAVLVFDIVFVLWGRTGYLALLVMATTTVIGLVGGSWRTKAAAGLAVAVCGAVLLAASPNGRSRVTRALDEIATVDQSTVGTQLGLRLVMWRNALHMIEAHPILGVGTGSFHEGYRPLVRGVAGWRSFETDDPHNQYLKIWGEQGLLGIGAFLFLIFGGLTTPAPAPYRQLAVAALLTWCVSSLANSHFSTFAEGRLIFFWLGAMLGGGTPAKAPASHG